MMLHRVLLMCGVASVGAFSPPPVLRSVARVRTPRACWKLPQPAATSPEGGGDQAEMSDRNPLKRDVGKPLRTQSEGDGTLTIPKEAAVVGTPQKKEEKSYDIETILKELQAIQNTGPKKYVILGTRHGSFMHSQIIELLSYALVLTGNHIFTSGSPGTNAAAIRGALRAERPELLTVILPQSLSRQPAESQELLAQVEDVQETPMNDNLSLDAASRICNSLLLSRAESLIAFAFHESSTVIEATKEAKSLDMVVTVLYLD
mmetsp:Transcript_46052/g.104025  ORF Transcript_46052/g.104025 Transcript_46052/m.104025 type:complete len:261 (+) Transcript_46052:168-950(+)